MASFLFMKILETFVLTCTQYIYTTNFQVKIYEEFYFFF